MKSDNPYTSAAARTLGGAKSEAKAEAARANGRKGGRSRAGACYAIISDSDDGPAFGVGTSKPEAWEDAAKYGIDDTNRRTCKCIEITEASYRKIKAGDPDAVEEA